MVGERTLTLECPAKVNLTLAVGAADAAADGRHPIASWMAALRFGDTLTLRRLDSGVPATLARRWADDAPRPTAIDWPVEDDLAMRACAALSAFIGRPLSVAMELTKRVPAGAGLGGGSGDAAAVLVGLDAMFDLNVARADLLRLAGTLGSDVVFAVHALHGTAHALVTGFGESIEPLTQRPAMHLVLLLPAVSCATGAVYRAFDARGGGERRADRSRALATSRTLASAELFNDLTEAAFDVAPPLRTLRDAARERTGVPVHLTGSGSAMFTLERSADAATQRTGQLRGLDVSIVVTQTR